VTKQTTVSPDRSKTTNTFIISEFFEHQRKSEAWKYLERNFFKPRNRVPEFPARIRELFCIRGVIYELPYCSFSGTPQVAHRLRTTGSMTNTTWTAPVIWDLTGWQTGCHCKCAVVCRGSNHISQIIGLKGGKTNLNLGFILEAFYSIFMPKFDFVNSFIFIFSTQESNGPDGRARQRTPGTVWSQSRCWPNRNTVIKI